MEFIPYQKVTITTNLSKEEIIERFKESIGTRPLGSFAKVQRKIFSGRLSDSVFDLSLNKDYRNSWTPEIKGTITAKDNLTELHVTLKANSFVIAFTVISIIIGIIMLANEIIDFSDFDHFSWTTLLFVIFPYGLCWFGFNLDADKSIDGLLKVTKGELK